MIVVNLTLTDLCAEESIGHDDSIKVKRLDKPKVKYALGSYPVKRPLKDDSLTPLSSDEAPTISNADDSPSTTFNDDSLFILMTDLDELDKWL